MPSVSSFDEVNACIQAGFSEKRLYSERVNSINGVFNVFVLISVISAQFLPFGQRVFDKSRVRIFFIRVIRAICVR